MDYVEAIDRLLGYVGQDVLVRVGPAEHHMGFVLVHGRLAQGEREVFTDPDDQVSWFGLGEDGDGFAIYRGEFTGANYDADDEKLTVWLGPIAISIEPGSQAYEPAPSD